MGSLLGFDLKFKTLAPAGLLSAVGKRDRQQSEHSTLEISKLPNKDTAGRSGAWKSQSDFMESSSRRQLALLSDKEAGFTRMLCSC